MSVSKITIQLAIIWTIILIEIGRDFISSIIPKISINIETKNTTLKNRKRNNSISRWQDNIYLDSESSFDYSENESDIPKEEFMDYQKGIILETAI